MQHVKTKIQTVLNGAAQDSFNDLSGFKYLLDNHLDKYVLGIQLHDRDHQPEIQLYTPKDRFMAHGEPDVDLLDSSIKILDDIELLALTSKLRNQTSFKNETFIVFKITNTNRSDGVIFLKFEKLLQKN